MIIDSHQHCWELGRAPYAWLDAVPSLHRSITIEELLPLLATTGVQRTVLVTSDDNDQDNEYLLGVADAHPEVAGVVAWAPLHDAERTAETLAALRKNPKFRGIRIGINHDADPELLASPEVDAGLSVLEHENVPFDVVSVRRKHLELVSVVAERHPDLPIVIDHLSKPPIKRDDEAFWVPWRTNMARAAEHPNVHAKISGLFPARGDMSDWTTDDVRPVIEFALEHFGASRLMFGSDWPISNLAGGYVKVWEGLSAVFAELSSEDADAILGGTAQTFYRIEDE